MPILLPITSRADVSELFTHSLEFKEKDCIIIFYFFCFLRSSLLINPSDHFNHSGGQNQLYFFFVLSEKDIIKARYPADLHDL